MLDLTIKIKLTYQQAARLLVFLLMLFGAGSAGPH
ncbi:MAG: hypothetical protein JWN73_2185 [Betaproteobacteria bacterium]|nr:hypothetical protein [Betaproteobacteria bacterium]